MIEIVQRPLFELVQETHQLLREKETLESQYIDVVVRIGLNLIEMRPHKPYGEFIPWLEDEFGISSDTAYNFIHVAEIYGNNSERVRNLPLRVVYQLAAPSTPETVREQVETGQIPATIPAIREAKQEIQTKVEIPEEWKLPVEMRIAPNPVVDEAREIKREQQREHIAQLKEKGVTLPTGKYSCLVVDPPWPMQKIERDVRPNQVEFDYPTMSEDELKAFSLPDFASDDCHLYLWTTQKHLPLALRLAEHWGFKYQCLMTWVKNVGFTPFSWMYSTEHVLFCTRGSLPLLRLGMRLDFHASVREHSRKPDVFYEIVKEVSPGPRLDVFSREKRDGFEQYGNEVEKFVSAR